MEKSSVHPEQTKLIVTFSTGMKSNIGNFESVDSHVIRGEEWDVTGLDPHAIDRLWTERYGRIKEQLDGLVEHDYLETSIYAEAPIYEPPEAGSNENDDI
jgi:hypothetical protein